MKSNFFEKLIVNENEEKKEKIRRLSILLDDSINTLIFKRLEKNNEEININKLLDDEKKYIFERFERRLISSDFGRSFLLNSIISGLIPNRIYERQLIPPSQGLN